MQVFDGLEEHPFGTIINRPVQAGIGAEMGDGAQIGPEQPDLRLLLRVAPLVRNDILPDRQEPPQEATGRR